MKSIVILGRQAALGTAELESLYGAKALGVWSPKAAVLDVTPGHIEFKRLGGALKAGKVLAVLDTTDLRKIETSLLKILPEITDGIGGKIQLGISAYDLHISPRAMLATGLTLKKALRKSGHSVRLVPNKELELNTASVLHNGLTGDNGVEILLARGGPDGLQTIIAQTVAVQDIESYTLRDRGRPKRDARVGMLPPKLAQIIINLAVTTQPPSNDFTVLDPFCGTGVILQEAMLMGYTAAGSDIDQRMGDYTIANLDWLWQKFPETTRVYRSWQLGDATTINWQSSDVVMDGSEIVDAKRIPLQIDAVASETYLGKPFTAQPPADVLAQTISECNLIIKKFLRNIGSQIAPGTRLCLAIPAWQTRPDQFKHLPLLDSLEELGYNRISFEHARDEDLIYYRADQIVARQLLVLTRN